MNHLRPLVCLLALLPMLGCGDEVSHHDEGISDDDRQLLEAIASDVAALEPGGDGFASDDRNTLHGISQEVADLGGGAGSFADADRALLASIAADVAPAAAIDSDESCHAVVPGLEVAGADGGYRVRLTSSNPPVHATGMYEWAIQILDADYAPVSGAKVTVETWMPAHDHGSTAVNVTDAGSGGVYTLTGLNFVMDGLWEVRIGIENDGTSDEVVINTCVGQTPSMETFAGRAVYVFSHDGDRAMMAIIDVDTMGLVKEMQVNDAGSWSDAMASPDGSRVFVNDRQNGQVHVIDAGMQMVVKSLDIGPSPVHMFNPNHGSEIWSHADAQGAFYAIDIDSLAVKGPVTAALGMTGHGKLLYDPAIAPRAYATNTADAAAFPIDLDRKTVGYQIKLCESDAPKPCASDGDCSDEGDSCDIGGSDTCGTTTHKVGGTHDEAISPFNGYAYFQCSGGSPGYALVDTATDAVVADMVEDLSGSAAMSADHRFILLLKGDDVHVLDTMNDSSLEDALTPDVSFSMGEGSAPAARGVHSFVPGGNYNDLKMIVPQTGGTKVWILNMAMIGMINAMPDHARTEVEVGALTAPEGASHFNRRGVVAGHYFFTMSDAGIVPVNLMDGTAGDPIVIQGLPQRFAYADNAGAVDASGGGDGSGHAH
ncbi:MAG: FixH family protein [Myxococcales bacterium]|nr:FixH family protein [Myxococcales bacterium]